MKTKFSKTPLLCIAVTILFCACKKDSDGPAVDEIDDPIHLECSYFSDNANVVLEDNPNAPVDYIINCIAQLRDDVTIEAGVTIAFDRNAALVVYPSGSLTAEGTASNPITLTATNSQKGWWGGVEFRSDHPRNKITHATIEYAGAEGGFSGFGGAGGVGYGTVLVRRDASLILTNSTIQHSAETGLSIAEIGGGGAQKPQVDAITLEGNTYTNNLTPARIPFSLVGNLSKTDTYSGNETDMVLISGRLQQMTVTMPKLEVPYHATSDLTILSGGSSGSTEKSHLIIEPGVEIAMGAGHSIDVTGGANYLTAKGTAEEPIIFRGADPTPGSWGSIRYRLNGPAGQAYNVIEHARISHGSAGPGGGNLDGVVSLQLTQTLYVTFNEVHFTEYTGTGCPVGGRSRNDWSRLTHSNLSDDDGRLPACIDD